MKKKLSVRASSAAEFGRDLLGQLKLAPDQIDSFEYEDSDFQGEYFPLRALESPIPAKLKIRQVGVATPVRTPPSSPLHKRRMHMDASQESQESNHRISIDASQAESTQPQAANPPPVQAPTTIAAVISASNLEGPSPLLKRALQPRCLRSIFPSFTESVMNREQEEALRALRLSSTDFGLFVALASTLTRNTVLAFNEDQSTISGMQILAEVLRLAPDCAVGHRVLARNLYDEKETLSADFPPHLQGKDRKWLLEEAYRLDSSDPLTLCDLAVVRGGQEGTKLALRARELQPTLGAAYSALGRLCPLSGKITLESGAWTNKELLLEAVKLSPSDGPAFFHLALSGSAGVTLLDGRKFTQQELFLEAVKHTPTLSDAYMQLVGLVRLRPPRASDIEAMRGYCIDALKFNPTYSPAYYSLATTLPNTGQITLADGRQWTVAQLLVATVKYNPSHYDAYLRLGYTLPAGGTIALGDGRAFTQQDLYREALKANSYCAQAYLYLALTLPVHSNAKVDLGGGTSKSRQELLLEAIKCNARYAEAFVLLGQMTQPGATIVLLDKRSFTKQTLYTEAISINPSSWEAYNSLGESLRPGESARLANGRTLNQQQLFIEALKYNPCYSQAYHNLATTIPIGSKVVLSPTRTLTLDEVLAEARKHDPRLSKK